MTVKQFLTETQFHSDDIIALVHPQKSQVVLTGNNPCITDDELAETHIIHEYRRNECDRTYYRIYIN